MKKLALILVVAVAFTVQVAVERQQPTFRSGVIKVRVDVLATDRGRPLTDLRASDFEVSDNGVLQKVELLGSVGGVDVVLVVDTSDSVRGRLLDQLLAAIRAVLDDVRPGDRVALMTFSSRMRLVTPLTSDVSLVRHRLGSIATQDSTSLYDALFAALSVADAVSGRSLLLVFTDGADNTSVLTASAVIDAYRRADVVPYVVATGSAGGTGTDFLEVLTDRTGGALYQADASQLRDTLVRILAEFRSRYLLTYVPEGVRKDDGWHRLQVRLAGRTGKVRGRTGYFAWPPGAR